MTKKILMLLSILAITLSIISIVTAYTTPSYDFSDMDLTTRVEDGIYYDYLVVETDDGNEWLLNDDPSSKYLDENGNAIFKDGQTVLVLFDTMGTEEIEDDVILEVYKVEYSETI